jgi:hypothetical protein
MAEDQAKCPDCGTPLWDVERRLEMSDRSHRHHAVDCVVVLKERVKTLEGDLHGAITEARELEEKAASADVFILKVVDGLPGEIDVQPADDPHSHRFVPTSTLDGYVPIELAQLKDTIISKVIGEKDELLGRVAGLRMVVNELRSKWYSEEGRASLALISSELDKKTGA